MGRNLKCGDVFNIVNISFGGVLLGGKRHKNLL